MMTAAAIAKGLELPKIHINYLYSEFMTDSLFEDNPLKKTVLSSREKDYIVEKYLDGVDFEHGSHFKEEAHALFPETKYEGKERTRKII